MTDVLIKAGRPDTSCAYACACYVGRLYSSAFVVASVFVVAYPTVCVCVYIYIYIFYIINLLGKNWVISENRH
jgi:hypothetical protein